MPKDRPSAGIFVNLRSFPNRVKLHKLSIHRTQFSSPSPFPNKQSKTLNILEGY